MISRQQLIQQIKQKKSFLCVGLDTDIDKIPASLKNYPDPVFEFNKRIIDATANRTGVSADKVIINIERYGNTTNGTIPLCLWEWEDKFKKGDNLILAAFGGGFTWGSIYLKWAY